MGSRFRLTGVVLELLTAMLACGLGCDDRDSMVGDDEGVSDDNDDNDDDRGDDTACLGYIAWCEPGSE